MSLKRLISFLVAVTMLLPMCVGITALAEETVTVTQNGTSIDEATGLPLSFTPTVNFPTAVAEGTDLTGITLTAAGSETPLDITVTPGAVTEATFTTATIKLPVLSAGVTYTLTIPAIGENLAKTVTFTTVGAGYIIKEDFNGSYFGDWYDAADSSGVRQENHLMDIDNDGVNDAFYASGGKHATLKFPTNIPADNYDQLTLETRVKFTPTKDAYTLSDNAINTGDANNGFLMRMQGPAQNNTMDLRTDASTGVLTYGGNNKVTYASDKSDYKIYKDTWYTIRVTMNSSETKFRVFITDDNGNSYLGSTVGNRWGSKYPTNPLMFIAYTYGGFVKSTIDYLYVWDNAALGEVTATYGDNRTLSGSTEVPTDAVVTLTFANDVTANDIAKIKISDVLSSTASETVSATATLVDSKTATLTFSNLGIATSYTLNIPQIGNNKAQAISFTTEAEPIPVVNVSGSNLEGAEDVARSIQAVVTFPRSLPEGTELGGISISDGTTTITPTVTAGKVTDGYFTTATIQPPILETGKTYTLTIPALGNNMQKNVEFSTVPDYYFLKEDFNGGYSSSWFKKPAGDAAGAGYLQDTDSDGVVDAMKSIGGDSNNTVRFPENIAMDDVTELTLETRVKYTATTNFKLEDGSLKNDGNDNNGGLLTMRGNNHNNNRFIMRTSSTGYLTYGGSSGGSCVSDYKLYSDKWYTFRVTFNSGESKAKIFVTDDDGNSYQGTYQSTKFGGSYPINPLSDVKYSYNSYIGSTIDYINIWDNGAFGDITATYGDSLDLNGANTLKANEVINATLTFENAITEADLAKISSTADVALTLASDGKSAAAVISGLVDYSTTYYIEIPQFAGNKATVISFKTEALPVTVTYEKGGEAQSLIDAKEVPTSFAATISFQQALAEDADLSKITVNGGTVTPTISADRKTVTLDISGLEKASKYTVTIPKYGQNDSLELSFVTVMAEYLFRAEFEGNDDAYTWYDRLEKKRYKLNENDSRISNGYWNQTFDNSKYRAFTPTFSLTGNDAETWNGGQPAETDKMDVTNKKHVQISTRLKFGETGSLDNMFMYVGNNRLAIGVKSGAFIYDVNAGKNDTYETFMVYDTPMTADREVWYTIVMDINFETSSYTVSIDDGNGNVAHSSPQRFINLATGVTEITDIRMCRTLKDTSADVTYDYLRIVDKNYGKVEVTYDAGTTELDGSALVPVSDNIFEFALDEIPADLTGIKLVDEYGKTVTVATQVVENTVYVIPETLNYNTKYTLTIPKEYLGSETDQESNFTTVWNGTAEFAYPEGYSEDDKLKVVFYGGSITYQEGWRVVATNWIKEKFPNAVCYNKSVGGTGANHGWQRLERDAFPVNPDIVFIEFAANDASSNTAGRDLESIIRNLNKLDKPPVIILVYTTVSDFKKNINTIQTQEQVAKHYSISTINVHDYVQTLYQTDPSFAQGWDGKTYIGSDRTHPTSAGSTVYGNYVTALLNSDASKYFVTPSANAVTEPMYSDFRDYTYDVTYVNKTMNAVGDTYEFTFEGDRLGLEYTRREGYGIFKLEVDGAVKAEAVDCYYAGSNARPVRMYTGFGEGTHTAKITVTGQNESATDDKIHIHSYYENDSATKITRPVFSTDKLTAGEEITVYTSWQGQEVKDGTIYIATYNNEDKIQRLIDAGSFTTTAVNAETYHSIKVTPQTGETKIKAFVWDSLGTMMPLAASTVLE